MKVWLYENPEEPFGKIKLAMWLRSLFDKRSQTKE